MNIVKWEGTKESWEEIMNLGIKWNQWSPGPMGSNSFFLEGKKVEKGNWISKDDEGNFVISIVKPEM